MKNDIADILFNYTTGEATLEETNDALKEAEAGFNLEPGRNEITPDEMALTTVGDTPEEANGFGLLDTGTGSMEKVHVTNGKLDEAINQVNHDGTTNMLAFVIIGPNRYEVKGDTLTGCYGFDAVPTWEDITAMVQINRVYNFTNKTKTASKWGVNIRFTITKNEGFEGEVSISGFGGAYE